MPFITVLFPYIAPLDYAVVNTVVVFPVGSSGGDTECVNVTIVDDDVIEETETFTLQASAVDTSSLVIIDPSLSQTTVAIADSESKCLYQTYWLSLCTVS